eukprot:Trichotokara_eunicae@DN2283_c0_g1_i1.p1
MYIQPGSVPVLISEVENEIKKEKETERNERNPKGVRITANVLWVSSNTPTVFLVEDDGQALLVENRTKRPANEMSSIQIFGHFCYDGVAPLMENVPLVYKRNLVTTDAFFVAEVVRDVQGIDLKGYKEGVALLRNYLKHRSS